MAIPVEKLTFCKEDRETCIHSLPCKVHFDGEARVNDFFIPDTTSENTEFNVSFRGYPLNGIKLNIPEKYHGFILKEHRENTTRIIYNEEEYKSITYWNWDKKPSENDMFCSALGWMDLSHQIHDPIEDESSENL